MHKIFFAIIIGLFLIASCARPTAPDDDIFVPIALDTLVTGKFNSVPPRNATGDVAIVQDSLENRKLIFYNFVTDEGNDVHVYLSKTELIQDGIYIAKVQNPAGFNSYNLDENADHLVYNTVIIWDERFDEIFGTATLN